MKAGQALQSELLLCKICETIIYSIIDRFIIAKAICEDEGAWHLINVEGCWRRALQSNKMCKGANPISVINLCSKLFACICL